jgi:uncharacterized RDD family membrane protein YckC
VAPPTAPPLRYAGLVSRLAALTLDVGLLTVAALAVSVLPGLAWDQVVGRSPGWLTTGSAMVAALLPWAYFTVGWWLNGETVGALVLGLVVRRRDGGSLSFPQAALRGLVGLLIPPVWLVGMLAVLWDAERRAWHDRLFRTVVCYAPSARTAAAAATRRPAANGP